MISIQNNQPPQKGIDGFQGTQTSISGNPDIYMTIKIYPGSRYNFSLSTPFSLQTAPPITATHVPHLVPPDKNKSINGQVFPN